MLCRHQFEHQSHAPDLAGARGLLCPILVFDQPWFTDVLKQQ